ncbi:cytochrome ubiquinol oxidase subunit I [Oceanidesulfovibrio indonesiensis]|uniref:Cytochrome ubiquinol oxidase subunit I n=1 Tax=Oceanidesulfovibrio indonesiensis TaxID=54767 RepID=A0A7M3MFV4_9BACT|nr:cytochrome ubiquinol oxidase subunit I [Oceanidesulfovibrio indonesiensis]TVM17996.1 cytochrome ubiquinol oxidase subunit I [Oceanidesulfovibrio indonesiensis]
MDVLLLSRLQFAVATFFHFIFVPLTLGLSIIIAIMETKYVRSGDEEYKRMAKFWGKLFLINFALGVVTGITLEFQFGTNWSRYSAYVGDIFGSLLAVEATAAFFLESTFIAVWVFGWERISKKLHMVTIWLVALAANLSAFWIIMANGFMQHPVGYVMRNGRAELDDFFAVITNPFAWHQFVHTLFGSWMASGFFVLGVSAYHLMKKNEVAFFKKSFNIGLVFALVFSVLVATQGHFHGNEVSERQPTKLAAMESHWETQTNAPFCILTIPKLNNEGNYVETMCIPSLLSLLAFNDPGAEVVGLNDFPKEDRPPVLLTFLSFRLMIALGMLFPLLAILAWYWRNKLPEKQWFGRLLIYAIPLPIIALEAGWALAEVGRQPWIVWGIMRTSEAVSPVATSQVATSLVAIILLYTFLGIIDIFLLKRVAQRGPATQQPAQAHKE